jgi:transcriptional regulator with XRE-family HTH domain
MTSRSALDAMTPEDRALYGFAVVRNAAFEAVQALWRRRKAEGLTQLQLAERIGRNPARISKYLKGPGNWTLRTFGELVEALAGEAEITVYGLEDPLPNPKNYDAYAEMDDLTPSPRKTSRAEGTQKTVEAPKAWLHAGPA